MLRMTSLAWQGVTDAWATYPYTMVGVCRTTLGRFSTLDISTVEVVSIPKRSRLETSRGQLSEHVSFGIATLLVVDQTSLECLA